MKKYPVVNMQEDEDNYSAYSENEVSLKNEKNNDDVKTTSNTSNNKDGVVKMIFRKELLHYNNANRTNRK